MHKRIFIAITICISLFSTQVIASFPSKVDSSINKNNESINLVYKNALQEFKSLSRKERRLRIKDAKSTYKHYKADKKAGKETDTNTLLLAILCILLPPLAVYLHEEEINNKFWLSLLLTLLFWLPGVIYALLVIFGEA